MNFEAFWSAYPRKVGKAAAEKSWNKLIKMNVTPDTIIAGAKRYAAAKIGTDTQYIAHPTTWLNQQRFNDEATETASGDEPDIPVNQKKVEFVQKAKAVIELQHTLVERTRRVHRHRVEEAARRLQATEPELWSCLVAGADGIHRRAFKAAEEEVLRGINAPEAINIDKNHWISARDRLETRRRHGSVAKKLGHLAENGVHFGNQQPATEGNDAAYEDERVA